MKGGGEEKMRSQNILVPIIAVTIAAGTLVGIDQVYAQSNGNADTKLVQMIAQKFNLDQSQVQSVFDQYRQQQQSNMQQMMQQRTNDRLTKAVQAGKITDTQKQDIITELAKLKSEYSPTSLKNLTSAQRKEKFQAEQNEINTWAAAEGVSPTYLRPGFGIRMARFGKGTPTPTPTP